MPNTLRTPPDGYGRADHTRRRQKRGRTDKQERTIYPKSAIRFQSNFVLLPLGSIASYLA